MTIPALNRLNRRFVVVAALALLGAAVFLLRIFPSWEFLAPGGDLIILPETDPYYHFRQALYTLKHFPSLMRWDADSRYPDVLRNDAAGLYDLLLATLAKAGMLLTGATPERALHWVCLFLPPAGAALLVPLVFGLVRRQTTLAIALIMALWCVLLPGDGLMRTSLGFCDHHVIEMVLSLLCIRGAMTALRLDATTDLPWWRPAWSAALPLALFFFTWLGAPLYLPIFALAFAGQVVADAVAGRDIGPTTRAAMRYWLAFLVFIGVAGLVVPSLIMHIRLWQGSLAGTALLLAAFPALQGYFKSQRLPLNAGAKAILAGVTLAAAGLAVLAFPGTMREAVHDLLARKSPVVQEHVVVTTRYFLMLTGLAGVLALLTPAAGVLTGAARKPGWWLAVLPSLLLVALWCRTFDYAYLGALHAVVLAGYFWGACDSAANTSRRRWLTRGLLAGASVLVLAGALVPGGTVPLRPDRKMYAVPGFLPSAGWREAVRWLRSQPVPASRERAGALTDWPNGNLINTLAGWPSVSSRCPEAEPLNPLFMQTEEEARSAPLRGKSLAEVVRYVVLEPYIVSNYFNSYLAVTGIDPSAFLDRQVLHHKGASLIRPGMTANFRHLLAWRLVHDNGDGLAHFRLVFESHAEVFTRLVYEPASGGFGYKTNVLTGAVQRDQVRQASLLGFWKEGASEAYDGEILPAVRIYEQVNGARLSGHASANAQVTASLELEMGSSGRRFQHSVSTRAGDDGRFTLTVPYSTNPVDGILPRATGLWKVTSDTITREVEVSEQAVREGILIILRH